MCVRLQFYRSPHLLQKFLDDGQIEPCTRMPVLRFSLKAIEEPFFSLGSKTCASILDGNHQLTMAVFAFSPYSSFVSRIERIGTELLDDHPEILLVYDDVQVVIGIIHADLYLGR